MKLFELDVIRKMGVGFRIRLRIGFPACVKVRATHAGNPMRMRMRNPLRMRMRMRMRNLCGVFNTTNIQESNILLRLPVRAALGKKAAHHTQIE